jgi:hypothetical protein
MKTFQQIPHKLFDLLERVKQRFGNKKTGRTEIHPAAATLLIG